MLTIHQVSKYYGNFCALRDIELEFENGVYGLLAPNGAGKTTLLRMLVTLLHPSSGEIRYDGVDIYEMDEQYRELLGYLPQDFGYYRNNTPRQYLMYLSALKGMERKAAKEKIDQLMELVGLQEASDKKMKKFSGGMIQRVGIAQAMLNDPKILILDEPTAGLDPKERVRFRNVLTDLARDRIVLLSTHIVSDVESIANEIIMIKDRQVLYKDRIENICRTIDGIVYETEIDFERAHDFRQRHFSLSEKQEGGKLKIRFLSTEGALEGWRAVKPGLEDVFLHIYQDEKVGR